MKFSKEVCETADRLSEEFGGLSSRRALAQVYLAARDLRDAWYDGSFSEEDIKVLLSALRTLDPPRKVPLSKRITKKIVGFSSPFKKNKAPKLDVEASGSPLPIRKDIDPEGDPSLEDLVEEAIGEVKDFFNSPRRGL